MQFVGDAQFRYSFVGLHSDLFLGSSDQLSSSPQYESNEELHQGMLSALADDIINLVMSLDVVHFKTMLDKSRATNQEQDEELRRRQELIMDLECKVRMIDQLITLCRTSFLQTNIYPKFEFQLSVMEVELNSALEERNRARNDASESSLAQDDVVSQAREDRDAAITRRTKAEIELAKTRVELMQANSQLLEAIHQKVELSQQLEQWQVNELVNMLPSAHTTEEEPKSEPLT